MATGYILQDRPNPNTPQGTYPRRGGARLSGTGIVHTSEGPWRNGVQGLTNFVGTRTDYGCYHRACDWADIATYYHWEWETWQDSETNNWAVGIAAACRATDWAIMPANIREGFYRNMARMAADFVTYMKTTYRITVPLRRITGAQARARVPGFCAHGDSGISRSDPGANFDWALFFKYTAEALGAVQHHDSTPAAPKPEPKEWYEMAIPKADLDAIARAVHHTQLPIGAKGTLSHEWWVAKVIPDGIHHLKVESDALAKTVASQNAQIKSLVGAVAALAQGEPFDEAKLLAGVQSAAAAGVKESIESVTTTTTAQIKE